MLWMIVEPLNASDERGRAAGSLHYRWIDQQLQPGMPPAHHLDDVVKHRSSHRGHDAYAPWKRRQRPLAGRIEQAFGEQTILQLLVRKLQRSSTARLHGFGNQLQLTALVVHRDP